MRLDFQILLKSPPPQPYWLDPPFRFRLVCPQKLIILFPPAKCDFNDSVSLNAFALKAATSAVIVEHSSNDLEFLLIVHLECQYRHFRFSAI